MELRSRLEIVSNGRKFDLGLEELLFLMSAKFASKASFGRLLSCSEVSNVRTPYTRNRTSLNTSCEVMTEIVSERTFSFCYGLEELLLFLVTAELSSRASFSRLPSCNEVNIICFHRRVPNYILVTR